jgi:hypothetical protein
VVEGEHDGAVAAGGQTDERAPAPRGDRAVVGVDVAGELGGDGGLPVAAGAVVEVLGIRVGGAGALRGDDDRAAAEPLERAGDEVERAVGGGRRRQAVQEVDDREAGVRLAVAGRQVDGEAKLAAERGRAVAVLETARAERGLRRERQQQERQQELPHGAHVSDPRVSPNG